MSKLRSINRGKERRALRSIVRYIKNDVNTTNDVVRPHGRIAAITPTGKVPLFCNYGIMLPSNGMMWYESPSDDIIIENILSAYTESDYPKTFNCASKEDIQKMTDTIIKIGQRIKANNKSVKDGIIFDSLPQIP